MDLALIGPYEAQTKKTGKILNLLNDKSNPSDVRRFTCTSP